MMVESTFKLLRKNMTMLKTIADRIRKIEEYAKSKGISANVPEYMKIFFMREIGVGQDGIVWLRRKILDEGKDEFYCNLATKKLEKSKDCVHTFYMARRTSFLLEDLSVKCELHYDGRLVIQLQRIYAVDPKPQSGNGYMHAVMQGLKMGIIANQKYFSEVSKGIFGRDNALYVILKVLTPYSETTLGYLERNEGYPEESLIHNSDVEVVDENPKMANSLILQLMPKDSGASGWYWNVYTDCDHNIDSVITSNTRKDKQLSESEEGTMDAPIPSFSDSEEESDDDLPNYQEETIDPPFPSDEQRMRWIMDELNKHNQKLQENSEYQLIKNKPNSVLFCLESSVGSAILSGISQEFWGFIQRRLDETFKSKRLVDDALDELDESDGPDESDADDTSVEDKERGETKDAESDDEEPISYANKMTDAKKLTTEESNMHLRNPLMFATLCSATCKVQPTPKSMPEYAYSTPILRYEGKSNDALTEEHYPISNFVLDFEIEFDKRAAFGYMSLAEGVLQQLVQHIGEDLLLREDMFVRSLSVRETCTELGAAHPERRAHYNFLLYGQGLQLDRMHDPNKNQRPSQQRRTEKQQGSLDEDVVMTQGARMCCQRCRGEFSLLRSLQHFHRAHGPAGD